MPAQIKPSDVKKGLMDSPWQNCEKETIAQNILKLAHFSKNDSWKPFSWDEYVAFCSHTPSWEEKQILDEFVETGYLGKDVNDIYFFLPQIIDVYKKYC